MRAEKRGGPRYGPVISGDPEMTGRKTGHGVRRFRTSACRRSAPPSIFGAQE